MAPDPKAQSTEDRLNAHIAASGAGQDPWQTLGSPGITNFTSDHGRYRMHGDEVEIDIVGHATGNVAAGGYNYASTLASAYRPAIVRAYPVGAPDVGNWYRILIGTDGTVTLHVGALVNGNTIGCCIFMPLD